MGKQDTNKPVPLPEAAHEALRQLWREERPQSDFTRLPAYPGAIGRAGTTLVGRGLAQNLGREVYGGSHRKGEVPEAWVKFCLTAAGRKLARELFGDHGAPPPAPVPDQPDPRAAKSSSVSTPPVAAVADVFLVYRPSLDYEDSLAPYFICYSRIEADEAVGLIVAFMQRLLKRLPEYPEEDGDHDPAEDEAAAAKAKDVLVEAQIAATDRKDAIVKKARWPFGLTGLADDITLDCGEWKWNPGSVEVMPLPLMGYVPTSAAPRSTPRKKGI